jgi:hypothetical protein
MFLVRALELYRHRCARSGSKPWLADQQAPFSCHLVAMHMLLSSRTLLRLVHIPDRVALSLFLPIFHPPFLFDGKIPRHSMRGSIGDK